MTAASGVPPWARPVLEALQLAHSLRTSDAVNGRCATSGEIEMADARVRDACAAALASDAGTEEGEPEYRCLRCQGPIPEDALRMGEFNHCSERCAAPLAESGAAAPPTNAPETSTSLVDAAPDAELDRLLIEYARCQVQARYASLPQPEINRLAYAVEDAAAAIRAHVERRVRESAPDWSAVRRAALIFAQDGDCHALDLRLAEAGAPAGPMPHEQQVAPALRREKEDV